MEEKKKKENILWESLFIVQLHSVHPEIQNIREDLQKKKFSFGHCPNKGGGVYPCPNFLAPFFYQVIVLKIAFFTQTSQ